MTKCGRVTGLTLDTGALLALERGDSRVRALLRRALESGIGFSVPAGVVAQSWRGGPRQARVARLLGDPAVDEPGIRTSWMFTWRCMLGSRARPWLLLILMICVRLIPLFP